MTVTAALLGIRPKRGVRRVGRRGRRGELIVGVGVVGGIALLAIAVPILSPYGTTELVGDPFLGPSSSHLLGTDNLGRDSFTRLASAARIGLLVSVLSTALAMTVGTAAGVAAGYLGGVVDQLIMRAVDVFMAIPALLMALVVRVVFGTGLVPLVISLGIICAPAFARVMRGPALALRERDFVVAAEVAGVRKLLIAIRHILPNSLTPLFVQAASTACLVVLLEAILSYLGQGVQPPDPSAGRMISEFVRFMSNYPVLIIAPAVLITLMTVGWNLMADGLQARLAPQSSRLQAPLRTERSSPAIRSTRTPSKESTS